MTGKEEEKIHQKQLEKITAEIDSISKEEAMARVAAKGEVKAFAISSFLLIYQWKINN
jgi:hypothetical protein